MRTPDSLTALVDHGIIEQVLRPLMSGKEAQIYLVLSGGEQRVAKIYKEAQNRSFQNRADYTEGRKVRNSRDQRAMGNRSKHGKAQNEAAWKSAEVDMIYRLRDAGVRVPVPYHFIDGVLIMELVTDAEGFPAPRLGDLTYEPEEATAVFNEVMGEVIRMLCAGVVHGDLSDFNVLMSADGPVIIDFPQAVDASSNANAKKLLLRDVDNLHRFHAKYAPGVPALPYAQEMWDLYQRMALTPDTRLTGKFRSNKKVVSTEAVLDLIADADHDERRRREGLGLSMRGTTRDITPRPDARGAVPREHAPQHNDRAPRTQQAPDNARLQRPERSGNAPDNARFQRPERSGNAPDNARFQRPERSGNAQDKARAQRPERSGNAQDNARAQRPEHAGNAQDNARAQRPERAGNAQDNARVQRPERADNARVQRPERSHNAQDNARFQRPERSGNAQDNARIQRPERSDNAHDKAQVQRPERSGNAQDNARGQRPERFDNAREQRSERAGNAPDNARFQRPERSDNAPGLSANRAPSRERARDERTERQPSPEQVRQVRGERATPITREERPSMRWTASPNEPRAAQPSGRQAHSRDDATATREPRAERAPGRWPPGPSKQGEQTDAPRGHSSWGARDDRQPVPRSFGGGQQSGRRNEPQAPREQTPRHDAPHARPAPQPDGPLTSNERDFTHRRNRS